MSALRTLAAALALVGVVFAVGACVTDADRAPETFACPSDADWPVVSQVLEHGCGTLECHGAASRPLRLYGVNGTRLSEFDHVGVERTTDDELAQNRLSVCGLEPEVMAAVVAGDSDLKTLTVVRKPLLIEAHKGGRVWIEKDSPDQQASPGYACFASWIAGDVNVAACDADLAIP